MLEDNTRPCEEREEGEFRTLNRMPFSLGTSHEKDKQQYLSDQDNPSEPLNDYWFITSTLILVIYSSYFSYPISCSY
jgi:hypothetical protein